MGRLELAMQVLSIEIGSDVKMTVLQSQATISSIEGNVQVLLNAEEKQKLHKVLDWLSAPDPYLNHNEACRRYGSPECRNYFGSGLQTDHFFH